MKCYAHDEKDAVGQCKTCGKGICKNCAVEVSKQLYCRNCAAAGTTSNSGSTKKDPMIALLLGLIPIFITFCGIGQMYVGRVKRGLVFLLVGWGFGVLNLLGLMVVVGICITGPLTLIFVCWQAYDAYKLAQEYNERLEKDGKPPW